MAARLPAWYRQAVNAPTFLLLPLQIKGKPLGLIYADKAMPGGLALEGRLGGSPFNVAVGLARLGQPVAFLSQISRGFLGERLMRELVEHTRRDTPVRVLIARIVLPAPASVGLHEKLGFQPIAVDHDRNAVYGFRKKDGRRATAATKLIKEKKKKAMTDSFFILQSFKKIKHKYKYSLYLHTS